MVSITIPCKNFKNRYDREENPDKKGCHGLITIIYSKHRTDWSKIKLEFTCEECTQKGVKDV